MNKGFTKISLLIGAAIVILLAFFLVTNVFATQKDDEQTCQYTCPTVHFEWQTTVYDNCPANYSVQNDTTKCRKNYYPWTLIDRPSHQVSHSADVKYDKSQDPHKCHRPSDNDLSTKYGMDHDTRLAFKQANSEWKDSTVVENSCPVPTVTPTPTDTPTPTSTPTDTPKEVCEDESATNYNEEGQCEYPEVDPCDEIRVSKDAILLDNECEEEEPTPTPTPTETPKGEEQRSAPASASAPVCSDGNVVQLPANPHVVRNGSSATVNFFITSGDSANVYWKVTGGNEWQHSLSNVKPNSENFVSVTINGLDPELGYDFGVQQKLGCGGGQLVTAVVIDGPSPVTFRFSYWEWSK